ncbi:MAG: hypothetical protein GOVbin556_14 [Prokaryotic dsDNA virus sp.]|nr:MAG: hypothetical protein GOVbin556_14 [Prokaryotic dsDNA virus sp.]|tara:strand:- start:2387 stop:2605 length:219 start_codon:yes stop_codon:yes gene_type:complete
MNDDDELLGRIPRDAKKEWKVVRGKYWNTEYVDIRLYENNKPTKKGARLNLEEIVYLKQILTKINIFNEEEE